LKRPNNAEGVHKVPPRIARAQRAVRGGRLPIPRNPV